jgi:hypothetical protein
MSDEATTASLYSAALLEQEAAGLKCNAAAELCRPCVIWQPRLSIDGNQWCALYGENLVEGVAGFGDSPEKAMEDFDRNWRQPLRGSPSSPEMEEVNK